MESATLNLELEITVRMGSVTLGECSVPLTYEYEPEVILLPSGVTRKVPSSRTNAEGTIVPKKRNKRGR